MNKQGERAHWGGRIAEVVAAYGDPEVGHSLEDGLLGDFVNAIEHDELHDPSGIAAMLAEDLLTIDRTRWYA